MDGWEDYTYKLTKNRTFQSAYGETWTIATFILPPSPLISLTKGLQGNYFNIFNSPLNMYDLTLSTFAVVAFLKLLSTSSPVCIDGNSNQQREENR